MFINFILFTTSLKNGRVQVNQCTQYLMFTHDNQFIQQNIEYPISNLDNTMFSNLPPDTSKTIQSKKINDVFKLEK